MQRHGTRALGQGIDRCAADTNPALLGNDRELGDVPAIVADANQA
jgi:hypothetical protein